MTVSTELSHEEYVGNGVTTDFDFRFRIFESKHLIVVVADSEGNETTLKNGTDYTIVGAGSYHGGKVVLNKPLAQGWKILLERDLPVVQETDLRNQGKFFAEVHEDAFDYLTMLIQKALGTFSLSLRKPTYLSNYYDAKGNHIANLAPPKLGTDAANKDYVDNSIKNIDSKTLRVKDKPIPALPSAEQRRNKQLGFDNEGYPQLLDPAETGSLGYVLVDSFEKGAEITTRYQALHWESNGEYYRWDGDLPKLVPINSTPEYTGGVNIGAWISIGNLSLSIQVSKMRDNLIKGCVFPENISEYIKLGDYISFKHTHVRLEIKDSIQIYKLSNRADGEVIYIDKRKIIVSSLDGNKEIVCYLLPQSNSVVSILDFDEYIDISGSIPCSDQIQSIINMLSVYITGEDNHGITLYFPRGDYLLDKPIILPKSSVIPRYIINIVGDGILSTRFIQSINFPENRGAFEWEQIKGPINFQSLKNFTIKLANIINVKAIYYKQQNKSNLQDILDNTFRNFEFKNIYILGSCEYHNELIKLEGNVKYGKIDNITADCTPINHKYDPIVLSFDYSEYPNDDGSGIHYSDISNIYAALRRGGYHTLIKGRLHGCNLKMLHNTNGNKNSSSFHFINSVGVFGQLLINEGKGGKQFIFDNCRGFNITNIALGTPLDQGGGIGDGITIKNCRNLLFSHQNRRSGNPTFYSKGVKMVSLEGYNTSIHFKNWDVNTTPELEINIPKDNDDCYAICFDISKNRVSTIGNSTHPNSFQNIFKFKDVGANYIDAYGSENHIINDDGVILSNILNGKVGQKILIIFRASNTTINNTGNIRSKVKQPEPGDVICFIYDGNFWIQI